MISQQTLSQRRGQRQRKADHLTIPMEQERFRTLHYEQYLALNALDQLIGDGIHAMRYEVYEIAEEQCDAIGTAFQELLRVISNGLMVLTGPDLAAEMRSYPLVMKLSGLHRLLIDAKVLVGNVRGQCRCGRLAIDPTGSYWHLRMCFRDVVQDYQCLLSLLKCACSGSSSATA